VFDTENIGDIWTYCTERKITEGIKRVYISRRNCLLKQVIEEKIQREMGVKRRRGRRCKKLLNDLKDRRGYSHLKEEALDRTMWRNRFGKRLWTSRQTEY
jgi:hypothetical protein